MNQPLRKTMCATCPFRDGSPYAYLAAHLAITAVTTVSRECHSTGKNGINKRTGIIPHLCRGARDVQIRLMHQVGFIAAPTDEAWNAKRVEMGMEPTVVQDPQKEPKR